MFFFFLLSTDDELVTPALRIWRNAVLTSESASQLSMCLSLLYDCIAWEKSIMKVVSQLSEVEVMCTRRLNQKQGNMQTNQTTGGERVRKSVARG